MNTIFELILNLIFPPKCNICSQIIKSKSTYNLCARCINKIIFISDNCCQKCGKELNKQVRTCNDCKDTDHYFDMARSIVKYSGVVRSLLINYKFYNRKEILNTLLDLLNNKISIFKDIDIIIGVPSHKKKQKKRGFNQSEELAKGIAQRINVEFDNRILIKSINTTSQSTLSREERLVNLKSAFKVININKIKDKNILIVDDIYTTGATISECARILKMCGAKRIYALTVASGEGY